MGTVSSLRVLLCVPLRNLRTASFRLNTPLQSAELTQPIALASGNSQIRWKCRRINPRLKEGPEKGSGNDRQLGMTG